MQETYQLDEDDVSMSDMEEMPVKTSRGRPKNETVEEKRVKKSHSRCHRDPLL